jgi:hypothetical protein
MKQAGTKYSSSQYKRQWIQKTKLMTEQQRYGITEGVNEDDGVMLGCLL